MQCNIGQNMRLAKHFRKNGGMVHICQDYYTDLLDIADPDPRHMIWLRRYWWRFKKNIWCAKAVGFYRFISRKIRMQFFKKQFMNLRNVSVDKIRNSAINEFKKGDYVKVRSQKEIFSTLDHNNKHKGLQFTREMSKYCEKEFKIAKKVDKILIETTGELRIIKEPTYILEGVTCDGSAHGHCDRMCYCFWRDVWLTNAD